MSDITFTHNDKALGHFSLQDFDIEQHSPLLQQWVNQPHAGFWGMQGDSLECVVKTQRKLLDQGVEMYLGCHEGEAAFLLEVYRPQNTELKTHMSLGAGDLGMHILIAQPEGKPRSGYSLAVFHCIMRFLFECRLAERVIVEPDARNLKVHALNRRVGFRHFKQVRLQEAGKDALLAYCSLDQFYTSFNMLRDGDAPAVGNVAEQQAAWQNVNRGLVCKALAEFMHERLLEATPTGNGRYHLRCASGSRYHFEAERLPLDHWLIDSDSLVREIDDRVHPLNLVEFIQDCQGELGIDDAMLPTYLEEISSTVSGQLWKHQNPVASSRELVYTDFQTVEQAMVEGHPCFVANSGKIGFDSKDFLRYAPESGRALRLVWLAVHRERADFTSVDGLDYAQHIERELGLCLRRRFDQQLESQGLSPADYWYMPCHPWQWHNQLQRLFAGEICSQRLVYLGEEGDAYVAQQSIRTFYNRSRPDQAYVKCALSILNMGFMRGLSSKYMSVTPAINQWVYDAIEGDAFLRSLPFHILREYAAIGYRHPQFDRGLMQTSPYNKMLAALWRENPVAKIEPQQKAITMAALLHVDRDGKALLAELIRASGLGAEQWLRRYLDVYLTPLLHCFYAHHMVFMPHGENLILIMENHAPVGAYIKDIGEEVCLLNCRPEQEAALPENVKRISVTVPHHVELLSIFTDVFDCFFRFLTGILHKHCGFNAEAFWELVAECIHDYQASQHALSDRFAEHDLFQESFALSCLNRLQLRNNKQMVDLLDPAAALQFAGELANPIARYASRQALAANA